MLATVFLDPGDYPLLPVKFTKIAVVGAKLENDIQQQIASAIVTACAQTGGWTHVKLIDVAQILYSGSGFNIKTWPPTASNKACDAIWRMVDKGLISLTWVKKDSHYYITPNSSFGRIIRGHIIVK